MAYSSSTDIQNELKGINLSDAAAALQTAQVDSFIAQGDAEIDGKLSTKYATPITGNNSLLIVKTISTYLALARCWNFLKIKTAEKNQDQSTGEDYYKRAQAMISDVQDGHLLLSDATLRQSANGVRSGQVDTGNTPFFDATIKQW